MAKISVVTSKTKDGKNTFLVENDEKIRYSVKCKICNKSFTTDMDPKTFNEFKCSKCGSIGKFDFKIIKKKEKKLPRDLTVDDVFAMFAKARKNPRDYKLLNFLFYFGLRNEEMRNLRRDDIDLKRGILKVVQGKGSKDRFIPIVEIVPDLGKYQEKSIYDKLDAWIGETKGTGYIFEGGSALGTLSDRHLRRIVSSYAKKAKITNWKEVHVHTLRHTYATHLKNIGVDLEIIQQVLGHEKIETTLIYASINVQLCREEIQKAVKIMQMKEMFPEEIKKINEEKNQEKRLEMKLNLLMKLLTTELGMN